MEQKQQDEDISLSSPSNFDNEVNVAPTEVDVDIPEIIDEEPNEELSTEKAPAICSSEEASSSSSSSSNFDNEVNVAPAEVNVDVPEIVNEAPNEVSTEKTPVICSTPGCNKDFTNDNKWNIESHEKACMGRYKKNQQKKRCVKTMNDFFPKRPRPSPSPSSTVTNDENESVDMVITRDEEISSTSSECLDHDMNIEQQSSSSTGTLERIGTIETELNSMVTDEGIECISNVNVEGVSGIMIRSVSSQLDLYFCSGYVPASSANIYQNFPFQMLETCSFVFSNGKFHALECANSNFLLRMDSDESMNWECIMLKDDHTMNRILERAEMDDPTSTINDVYLTFQQLKSKITHVNKQKSRLTIEKYKAQKKLDKLGKTVTLYQRFVVLISENQIPRLHSLVSVALHNNRNINYIVGKCEDAIAGIYRARPDADDRELAFLVLKFGGPSLLDILYRANLLPSTSLAYKMSKACKHIQSSVSMSFQECLEMNVDLKFNDDDVMKYTMSIRSDETFINPRLRYDRKLNQIVGVCYEHHKAVSLNFDTMTDVELLQDKLIKGEICIPKECLVTGISSVAKNMPFEVILMWPTCSKGNVGGMAKMYTEISDGMNKLYGAPSLNFNTDGASDRRQALHAITDYTLDISSELGKKIDSLPLVDQTVGKYNETKNFDPKHLAKRCWTSFISGKLSVAGVILEKKDLKDVVGASMVRTHDVNTLIFPDDKQNVPCATDCLLSFIDVVTDEEKQKKLPFKLTPILNELILLAAIYKAVLCLYTCVSYSLTEQIEAVAKGAISLLILNRAGLLTIPNQLYHDIQCTMEDIVYTVAKLQIHAPLVQYYTALIGTDPEERFFGNARLAYGHKNLDSFELVSSASSIKMCDEILQKHPQWVKKGRMARRLVLDHSNTGDWTGDLVVSHVDLKAAWTLGMLDAHRLAIKAGLDENPALLDGSGITLLKPRHRVIGVTEVQLDWSQSEEIEVVNEENEDEELSESDIIQLSDVMPTDTHKNYIEIEGKNVFKSTILKQICKEKPLSGDRLRKVRGLSKYCGVDKEPIDMNNMISAGDPLVIYHDKKMKVVIVVKLYNGQNVVTYLPTALLEDISTKVDVRELKLHEVDGNLFSTGKYQSGCFSISGKNCITVEPEISLQPPEGCTAYFFNKSLIQDIGVHITLASESNENDGDTDPETPLKCKVCKKNVPRLKMRIHVGKHILNNDVNEAHDLCGFCGKNGCKPSLLENTSSSGRRKFNRPSSNCVYNFPYKKVGDKATRYTPCTNRIVSCPSCNMCVWSYNLPAHFIREHPEEDAKQFVVSQEEKNIIQKTKI